MKYVHAAVSMNPLPGVVRQMEDEATVARELGLAWRVMLTSGEGRSPGSTWSRLVRYVVLRTRFYLGLIRLARHGHVILLRYSPGDPFFYLASFFLGRFFTVHHTLEEAELASSVSRLAQVQLWLERTLGRRALARASGRICVTQEIAHHEAARLDGQVIQQTLIYPNGILYPANTDDLPADDRGEQPEILFVASYFFDWHGLDLLLDSMPQQAPDALLHVVGDVPEPLLARARAVSQVRLHGLLDAHALQTLASRCWLGLSSFGLARKGMHEACTLKVREYLRAGLAVYAGHADSALPAQFAGFRQGPADWKAIVDHACAMRDTQRATLAAQARPFLDKKVLLARLHGELEAVIAHRVGA